MDNVVINVTEIVEQITIDITESIDDVDINITEADTTTINITEVPEEVTINVTENVDEVTIYAINGPTIWGSISGILSNQTDLQTALDAKEDLLGYNRRYWFNCLYYWRFSKAFEKYRFDSSIGE